MYWVSILRLKGLCFQAGTTVFAYGRTDKLPLSSEFTKPVREAVPLSTTFRPYVSAEENRKELTFRAILLGCFFGLVFGAVTVYVGLEAGLTVAASIPIAVLSISVLRALGRNDELAHSSIRFGLGRFNTDAEVDYVADKVIDVVQKLRELSPLYEMVKEGIDLTKIEWAAH